jgi:polar amino acid transport system substrate-binding protein
MRKWICLLLLAIGYARAQAQGVVVVAGDQFNRLFEVDANGGMQGLSVDVLNAIAKKTGDSITYNVYPWSRALFLVEHGKADMVNGMYKTPDREKRFLYSEIPYYQDHIQFYARAESNFSWDGNLASLSGKRIAVIRGWFYGPKVEAAEQRLQITITDNLDNGIRQLKHGLIDLLLANDRNMQAKLDADTGAPKIVAVEPVIDVQNGYFAFRKDTVGDALRVRYNRVLNEMLTSGELEKMVRAHKLTLPDPSNNSHAI